MALSKHALTTIDAVLAELVDLEADENTNALIARLINSASDAIRHHCGRDFARKKITEVLDGKDWRSVLLSLTPVVEMESVKLNGHEIGSYFVINETGELISSSGKWSANSLIAVEYTGGYITPQQAMENETLERDLPYDIEDACIITAATRFQYLGQPADIQMMQVEQIRVQFAGDGRQGLPEAAKALLEPFVRWA